MLSSIFMSKSFDIIIAGGGPAGSTAAILLAQYGYKVLLLERDIHPKFHIGESMMPQIDPIMQRMGFDWGAGNLPKSGGDFIDEASGKKVSFLLTGKYRTYQIERARFDAKLFGFAGTVLIYQKPSLNQPEREYSNRQHRD